MDDEISTTDHDDTRSQTETKGNKKTKGGVEKRAQREDGKKKKQKKT